MTTIKSFPELSEVVDFIEKMNSLQKNHIGYCGKKADEIRSTLEEDFTDVPARDAFVVAMENNKVVGVCGFDADLERRSAEIWGPFVDHDDAFQVSNSLWIALMKKIPNVIQTVSLFPDNHNKMVLDLGAALEFRSVSDQAILICTNQSLKKMSDDTVIKLSEAHYSSLVKLHDQIFPDTYLSGKEMLEGLNEENTVFGMVNNGSLIGYIYAEADPKFGEGSIEFFGVDRLAQGKGIGLALLAKGLQWLFSFPSIEETTLCVRSDNSKAIHLYKKVGFQVEHELTLLEKKIDGSA
ncbi:GNAT family N-acetyltransferase [Virgibacillus ihumii]|uniref:GNAT family N-acetyltransferase n=1 Tax=Virgibacillus ihumii TaxID=2686091 RepID=UPI00157E147A|nr:GNAT family N-acetyltransferase [Virgibacillus ihumii]